MSRLDRQRGCLYGLAIGDALGAPVEGCPRGEFAIVTGYAPDPAHALAPGEWTDDTAMAIALGHSLSTGFSEQDQLERYINWYCYGDYSCTGACVGIGLTTADALRTFALTGALASDASEDRSGNGAIMRLAPVPIRYHADPRLVEYCDRSAATTHASPQCRSACRYMGAILADLIAGLPLEQAVQTTRDIGPLHPEIQRIRGGSFKDCRPVGSGWVVESLEAALWCVWRARTFEEAVLVAVNLGDDADTTGAIAGQLAGARFGYSAIPQRLIDGLARKDMIEAILDCLIAPG
jgi:ADP-ribosyl-[dinitrogen reductase] hydrolase